MLGVVVAVAAVAVDAHCSGGEALAVEFEAAAVLAVALLAGLTGYHSSAECRAAPTQRRKRRRGR